MTRGLALKTLGVAAALAGLALGPPHLLQAHRSSDETTRAEDAEPADVPQPMRPIRRLLADRTARVGGANFVSACRYSHSAPDDPIVFPGGAGASHLHDFFANNSTDANSTYESLQSAGTTCRIEGDTAAYWVPALYDSGELVKPTHTIVYYRPGRKDHRTIQAFPAGLKVVAKEDNVRVNWGCVGHDSDDRAQQTVPTCGEGTHLVIRHHFPDCWDGEHLDSDDHTGHMTFAMRGACPSSHPVPVPAISVNVHYRSDGGDIVLGSPDQPVAPHADFFNAWDQPTLERLVRLCLNAGQHCGQRPPTA